MKRLLLPFVSIVCLSMSAAADQLYWIPEQDAKRAVELLGRQEYVLWYCGCCDDDAPQWVKIESVSCRPAGHRDYWEVLLEGTDADGNRVSSPIDLAYVHIKNGYDAQCVGLALNLECDPCVGPLKWDCPEF